MTTTSTTLAAIFSSRKFAKICLGSTISGMPLGIIFNISAWLTELDFTLDIITSFAFTRIFYSLKIFYAPWIENARLPILHHLFGKRKSWMVFTMLIITILLFGMSTINPRDNILLFRIIFGGLGLMSAIYDTTWDALRIEMCNDREQSLGVATASLGYRIGLFYAGALGFKLSSAELLGGWNNFYLLLAITFSCLTVLLFYIELPKIYTTTEIRSIRTIFIEPLKDLFSRQYAVLILLSVIFFKLGDAMLSAIATPFYLKMGFTQDDIFWVIKVALVPVVIVGAYTGALVCKHYGNFTGLIVCGILEMVTNLLYIMIHHYPTFPVFASAVIMENFTGAMGGLALTTYISTLCNKQYTATHYALLSSMATLNNNTIVGFSGSIAEILGWDMYIVFTTIIALPSLYILFYLKLKKIEA